MNAEARQCQNCQQDFKIEPYDFIFYEKMHVPPPTWCPDCRLWRQMVWINERGLHRGKCDLCKKPAISMFAKNSAHPAYCHECWWSDLWDPMVFGKAFDTKRSFWEQYFELYKQVPTPTRSNTNPVNSDYVNHTGDSKNCYLLFFSGGATGNEDCSYSYRLDGCKNCIDCLYITHCENCYELIDSTRCNNVYFGQHVENSFDSMFLYDCKNCSNCFGCTGLRNKQYCIFNKQYGKAEYERIIKEKNPGSYTNILRTDDEFSDIKSRFPRRFANITKSVNCTGDGITNSKNCTESFFVKDSEDSKYIVMAPGGVRDSYDVRSGLGEKLYNNSVSLHSSQVMHSSLTVTGKNIEYSYLTINCSDCFGCVGLRNKQYCILNHQYSKEEYEKLVPQIIENMNAMPYVGKTGCIYKYGEFFPVEESPFSYEDTPAQEFRPMTKEVAQNMGLFWAEADEKNYKITLQPEQIHDNIKDISDDILNAVIGCEHKGSCLHHCITAFKITPQELAFYRQTNLPLPRQCHNCRYFARHEKRNPLKLWHRKCAKQGCTNEFETSYSPDRPETVYCETCYQNNVI